MTRRCRPAFSTSSGVGPSFPAAIIGLRSLGARATWNCLERPPAAGSSCGACQDLVMVRLGTVVLGAGDVDRAVAFWAGALGYEPVRFPGDDNEFTILVPPSGEGVRVALQRDDSPAEEHPRVHLDLVVDNAAVQAAEIDRLIELGAVRVAWICTRTTPTSSCSPIQRATASASSTQATPDDVHHRSCGSWPRCGRVDVDERASPVAGVTARG